MVESENEGEGRVNSGDNERGRWSLVGQGWRVDGGDELIG